MNRNLHTTDSLTEFARDFEDEEESTIFTKFVNRLTNAYNTNYNSFNSVNSIDAVPAVVPQDGTSVVPVDANISPNLKESSPSVESETSSTNEFLEKVGLAELSFLFLFQHSNVLIFQQDEVQMDESPVGRTPVKVLSRISKILALKNNVSFLYKAIRN
jgi:hypothetical protein